MPGPGSSSWRPKRKGDAKKRRQEQQQRRKDPYDVLGVGRNATEKEIKSAYHRLALKYHPDKNKNDPVATDVFMEATFSYSILSDSKKRHQYDTSGFEAVELDSQGFEVDLSSLGTVNTMFAAIFSKLGVPIKTVVSPTVLEEALNGRVSIHPLQLGESVIKKVEKQSAHFYSVEISESVARMGVVCRVHSSGKNKFKLLYFDLEKNGGLSLALQEESRKNGKVASAAMFFLGFPVSRFDTSRSISDSKDPEAAFFKKLDVFQPCEINELTAGVHIFAVYGDNFFKRARYRIEVLSAEQFKMEKEKLRDVEGRILTKRAELSKFEVEHKQVLAQYSAVTAKYSQETQAVDELLKEWNSVQDAFTIAPKRRGNNATVQKSFKVSKEEVNSQTNASNSIYLGIYR